MADLHFDNYFNDTNLELHVKKLIYLTTVVLGLAAIVVAGMYLRYQNRAREMDISPDNIRTQRRRKEPLPVKHRALIWNGVLRTRRAITQPQSVLTSQRR